MIKTIVLLSSVSTDPSACTRATAIDFYPLPGVTAVCGLGDAMSAPAQLRPEAGKTYVMTRCERDVREATR